MRVAVTAMGPDLDAQIDPRFGRAQYILIVESDDRLVDVIDNSVNRDSMRGAGIQAGKTLADKQVDVLLTGNCGPNAFQALRAAGVKVGTEQRGTVREALQRLSNNEVPFVEAPNVDAHW